MSLKILHFFHYFQAKINWGLARPQLEVTDFSCIKGLCRLIGVLQDPNSYSEDIGMYYGDIPSVQMNICQA